MQALKISRQLRDRITPLALALAALGAFSIIEPETPIPGVGEPGGPDRLLNAAEADMWLRGRALFDKDMAFAEGLGLPAFNGDSCRACHHDPAIGGAGGADLNVFRAAFDNNGKGPFQDPPGGQIHHRMIRFDEFGLPPVDPGLDVFEQRQTPTLFGAGLIDAIPDAEILMHEDPFDTNEDGVFGVARLIDVGAIQEVGRFGWKAQLPRLLDFTRDASSAELGMTVPADSRGFGKTQDNDGVPDPELSTSEIDDLNFFTSHLAAPQRGGSTDPLVTQGEALFDSVGCATCHIPSLNGPNGPVPLFSNLLLHDVMEDTFRGMVEPGAEAGFYRTPPLWGCSKTGPWMHDGRAESLTEAILMHHGEGDNARLAYEALSLTEKWALQAFLEDL